MRALLALLVVAALVVVGVQAGQRMLDREEAPTLRATAAAVAVAWTDAIAAGDVDRLVELTADRADEEEVAAMHADVLVSVTAETGSVVEQGNEATAVVTYEAAPVEGASWTWEATLPLLRTRGVWSVDWVPAALHPDLDTGWRLEADVVEGSRAPVLDRDGTALSRTGGTVEVGVQPGRLPTDRTRSLLVVANALPAAYEPLEELLDRDDLRDDWYYPLTTVPVEVADEAWPDLLALPGIIRRDAEAGTGEALLAADVVGAVGTDEDGERVGTSGLELLYDDRLRGGATLEVRLLDPDGGDRGTLYSYQQDTRPPLVTTLDADVQRVLEQEVGALEGAIGVVAVDAATGGVSGIVSRPGTGFARALEGLYPPALVAGVVPLTAAVDAGAAPDDPLACPPSGTAGGVTVTTTRPGSEDGVLVDALTGRCDVGTARLGAALGGEALLDAITVLGLDEAPTLPVEAVGFRWPATTTDAAHASAAVGHARVQASALAGAGVAAAVARGAPAPAALLVEELVPPSPWPGELSAVLREAFRRAGEEGPVTVPGARVAGVATASGGVRGDPAPATGWWVGYLEGAGPDVALAVVVEGDDGGRAAAIAETVLRRLAAG